MTAGTDLTAEALLQVAHERLSDTEGVLQQTLDALIAIASLATRDLICECWQSELMELAPDLCPRCQILAYVEMGNGA